MGTETSSHPGTRPVVARAKRPAYRRSNRPENSVREQLSFLHQKSSSQDTALNSRAINALVFDIGQIQTAISALLESDEKCEQPH